MCGDMLLHVSTPSVACFYTAEGVLSLPEPVCCMFLHCHFLLRNPSMERCVWMCVFVCACVRP